MIRAGVGRAEVCSRAGRVSMRMMCGGVRSDCVCVCVYLLLPSLIRRLLSRTRGCASEL